MAEKPAPGPLGSIVSQAQNGELTVKFSGDVRVDAAEFAYIERDCEAFKIEIRNLQRLALNISEREHWGLGENTSDLTSAPIMVN